MDVAAEIEFLERLYSLPGDGETMNGELTKNASELERARRSGNHNPLWCFACGRTDVPTAACTCPHPENFGCVGHNLCSDCVEARKEVSDYLDSMFRTKLSTRVSSRRSRAYRFLVDAAESEGLRRGQSLRTCLLRYADPSEDEPVEFVDNVLRAFRRSTFFDFRQLAARIKAERDEFLVWQIVRSGILGRPPRVTLS